MTNHTATFGVPLFQSVIDSAFWKLLDPPNGGAIEVSFHPLPMTLEREAKENQSLTFVIVFLTGLAFSLVGAPFIEFLVRENTLGFKHQQLVSGVSLIAFWSTAWVWDVALCLVPALGTIVVFNAYASDLEAFTTTDNDAWDATRLVLVLYAPAVGKSRDPNPSPKHCLPCSLT